MANCLHICGGRLFRLNLSRHAPVQTQSHVLSNGIVNLPLINKYVLSLNVSSAKYEDLGIELADQLRRDCAFAGLVAL